MYEYDKLLFCWPVLRATTPCALENVKQFDKSHHPQIRLCNQTQDFGLAADIVRPLLFGLPLAANAVAILPRGCREWNSNGNIATNTTTTKTTTTTRRRTIRQRQLLLDPFALRRTWMLSLPLLSMLLWHRDSLPCKNDMLPSTSRGNNCSELYHLCANPSR